MCVESSLFHWWHLVNPSSRDWHFMVIAVYASSVREMRAYMSCMFQSITLNLASRGSGIGSIEGPGCGGAGILGALEKESRWIRACRDARRLISRRPTRSPRLKLPAPCLNSHKGESGDPVWNTSLTVSGQILLCQAVKFQESATFVKAIHVELSYKRRNVCMLEVLSERVSKEHRQNSHQWYLRKNF